MSKSHLSRAAPPTIQARFEAIDNRESGNCPARSSPLNPICSRPSSKQHNGLNWLNADPWSLNADPWKPGWPVNPSATANGRRRVTNRRLFSMACTFEIGAARNRTCLPGRRFKESKSSISLDETHRATNLCKGCLKENTRNFAQERTKLDTSAGCLEGRRYARIKGTQSLSLKERFEAVQQIVSLSAQNSPSLGHVC